MRAVLQNAYGGPEVLSLGDVEAPAIKKPQEVLVRVHAASLNAGDVFSMRGIPWAARLAVGIPRPKNHILGWDLAGCVEAVGSAVTHFRPGDEIYASCVGTLAELAIAPESQVARKPGNLSFTEAAAVPTAAGVALQELRASGKLQRNSKILVNGASGGVGTFSVQIAKAYGAEVTGVCSGRNIELVRSLGADHVIDYGREDFTQSDSRYDLILDNVGNHSFSDLRRVLAPDGIIQPNTGHAGMSYVIKAFALAPFVRQIGRMFVATPQRKDLVEIGELLEAEKITPVIDRTFPLAECPDAFRYLEDEHARGKVAVVIKE